MAALTLRLVRMPKDLIILNALPMLLADICDAYGLIASDSVVMGHRDLMATECPGNNLYKRMDEIRGNTEWYRNN